jgi:hypothetical protein
MSYLARTVVAEPRLREAPVAFISTTGARRGLRAPRSAPRALHPSSRGIDHPGVPRRSPGTQRAPLWRGSLQRLRALLEERAPRWPSLKGWCDLGYTSDMAVLVYLETSVISYLTAWPSRDVIVAGRQQLTHEWWSRRRGFFDVVVSELVHLECADGDPVAAARRADFLVALRSLDISSEAEALALALLKGAALPAKARADALHIAIAASVLASSPAVLADSLRSSPAARRSSPESHLGPRGGRLSVPATSR